MKRLIIAILTLISTTALAGTATLTWTNPTLYTDSSPLLSADISQTRIEYGSCSGAAFGTKAGEKVSTGAGTTLTISALPAGAYCFQAYTTAKGVESVASGVVSKVVPQAAPNPPTLVTVATTAFAITIQGGRLAMIPVGTVPLRTACRVELKIVGLNAIPSSAVTAKYRAPIYWARCA